MQNFISYINEFELSITTKQSQLVDLKAKFNSDTTDKMFALKTKFPVGFEFGT